jgi:hypothetical protein
MRLFTPLGESYFYVDFYMRTLEYVNYRYLFKTCEFLPVGVPPLLAIKENSIQRRLHWKYTKSLTFS